MFGDNGPKADFGQLGTVIAGAEVFEVGFPFFSERLLVDARRNHLESPFVQVVEPLRSSVDRMAWLSRRRPSLGAPTSISFIAWPNSAAYLSKSGIWQAIRTSVSADTDESVSLECEDALMRILELEAAVAMNLLKGENCYTLWPSREAHEGRREH